MFNKLLSKIRNRKQPKVVEEVDLVSDYFRYITGIKSYWDGIFERALEDAYKKAIAHNEKRRFFHRGPRIVVVNIPPGEYYFREPVYIPANVGIYMKYCRIISDGSPIVDFDDDSRCSIIDHCTFLGAGEKGQVAIALPDWLAANLAT